MDKAHAYIKEMIDFEGYEDLDGLIQRYYEMAGFTWMVEAEEEFKDVQFPEFELRSALEFVRPELTDKQLVILSKIDELYQEWISQDKFYKRYLDAHGDRFTWQSERDYVSEQLGRSIPKSHWWLWPPEA